IASGSSTSIPFLVNIVDNSPGKQGNGGTGMSHPFGELVWHHLVRKRGLSQNKLALGINQDRAVITRMFNGKALTGPQSRDRIVAIIEWLYTEAVLDSVGEANALLAAAGKQGLTPDQPAEARLLQALVATKPLPAGVAPHPNGYALAE